MTMLFVSKQVVGIDRGVGKKNDAMLPREGSACGAVGVLLETI